MRGLVAIALVGISGFVLFRLASRSGAGATAAAPAEAGQLGAPGADPNAVDFGAFLGTPEAATPVAAALNDAAGASGFSVIDGITQLPSPTPVPQQPPETKADIIPPPPLSQPIDNSGGVPLVGL